MFLCLLQNNIRGGEMFFEIEMPRLLYFKQHSILRRLFCNNHKSTSTLFLFYHGNEIKLIVFLIEERSRSICDIILKQNCRESCSLLHPLDFRNADGCCCFFFFKESFNLRCKCLFYSLTINIGEYLFL